MQCKGRIAFCSLDYRQVCILEGACCFRVFEVDRVGIGRSLQGVKGRFLLLQGASAGALRSESFWGSPYVDQVLEGSWTTIK